MKNEFYGEGVHSEDDHERMVAEVVGGEVFLPHSCDEWTIGGRKQVEHLISDLQRILETEKLIDDSAL